MKESPTLRRIKQRATKLRGDADPFYLAIANQVTEQRLSLELSQTELAELCGTTQSAMARVECGMRPPRIDTLRQIANALDCKLVVELKPRTKMEGESK